MKFHSEKPTFDTANGLQPTTQMCGTLLLVDRTGGTMPQPFRHTPESLLFPQELTQPTAGLIQPTLLMLLTTCQPTLLVWLDSLNSTKKKSSHSDFIVNLLFFFILKHFQDTLFFFFFPIYSLIILRLLSNISPKMPLTFISISFISN